GLRHAAAETRGRENLAEQAGELAPLPVLAAAPHSQREGLEAPKRLDLRLQLGDGARRGGLIEDLLLSSLDLIVGGVLQVLDVFGVERRHRRGNDGRNLAAALEQLQLTEPAL